MYHYKSTCIVSRRALVPWNLGRLKGRRLPNSDSRRLCKGVHPSPVRPTKMHSGDPVLNWQMSCSSTLCVQVRMSISTKGPFTSQWLHWQSLNLDWLVNLNRKRALRSPASVEGRSSETSALCPRQWFSLIFYQAIARPNGDRSSRRPSDRATEQSIERAVERSSDRALEPLSDWTCSMVHRMYLRNREDGLCAIEHRR